MKYCIDCKHCFPSWTETGGSITYYCLNEFSVNLVTGEKDRISCNDMRNGPCGIGAIGFEEVDEEYGARTRVANRYKR